MPRVTVGAGLAYCVRRLFIKVLYTLFSWVLLALAPLALGGVSTGGPAQPAVDYAAMDLPNGASPLPVTLEFELLHVHAIDDEAETIDFTAMLTTTWRDPGAAFDPAVDGVSERTFSGDYQFNEISPGWYPQVVLSNAVGVPENQGVLVRVRADGTSTVVQLLHATARSPFRLRTYPFDSQQMQLLFEVLGFDADEVVLQPDSSSVSAGDTLTWAPEWRRPALGVKSVTADGRSVLAVSIDMERHWYFMARLVLLPLAIIVILSWSVFWMERSSLGDRMAVSFVGILTAVSYQSLISEIMPNTAYITFLNAYVALSLLLMSATVLVNLLVGAMDRRGDFSLGDTMDRTCRWLFPLLYAVLVAVAWILVSRVL